MRLWQAVLALTLAAALGGCQLVYKLPTRQGNVMEQPKLEQLELGMTPEQVRFLLGTPLAANPYNEARWDYLGYYRAPRGAEVKRIVSLYFVDGQLARMDGVDELVKTGAVVEMNDVLGPEAAPPDAEVPIADERDSLDRTPGRTSPTDPGTL